MFGSGDAVVINIIIVIIIITIIVILGPSGGQLYSKSFTLIFFWKASVFCSSLTETCVSFLSPVFSELVQPQPASTENFKMHNVQNNPYFRPSAHYIGYFWWFLCLACLDLGSEHFSSLHCAPITSTWVLQRAHKGLVEHLAQLKRLKCYWSKLLVHCSAFPHVINNNSCFQTKLQTNAAIVSFIMDSRSVVIFSSKMEFTKRTVCLVDHQC